MAPNGKTILVVEDDEETLNILCRTLAAGGYDVIWARNGEDTMKALTKHDSRIALVVADVVLPGMSGPELVQQVARSHPGTGCVFISAYDDATVRSHGVDPDTMDFLAKPYEPSDLVRMVHEALNDE